MPESAYVAFVYGRMVWGIATGDDFLIPGGQRPADATLFDTATRVMRDLDPQCPLLESDFKYVEIRGPGGERHRLYYLSVTEDMAAALPSKAREARCSQGTWRVYHRAAEQLPSPAAELVRAFAAVEGLGR